MLTRVRHRFCITWREYIYITIIGCPNHLIILRFIAPTSITNLVCTNKFFRRHACIIEYCHPTFVRILSPLQFIFLICSRTRTSSFGFHQIFVTCDNPLTTTIFHSILAQSHWHCRRQQFAIALQYTGQCHILAISKKILRHIGFVGWVCRKCFCLNIEIRHQKHFWQIAILIYPLCRSVACRCSHNIFVINAKCSKSLNCIFARTCLQFALCVANKRTCCGCIPLIISQSIKILILIKHPLRRPIVDQTIAHHRHIARIERRRRN